MISAFSFRKIDFRQFICRTEDRSTAWIQCPQSPGKLLHPGSQYSENPVLREFSGDPEPVIIRVFRLGIFQNNQSGAKPERSITGDGFVIFSVPCGDRVPVQQGPGWDEGYRMNAAVWPGSRRMVKNGVVTGCSDLPGQQVQPV